MFNSRNYENDIKTDFSLSELDKEEVVVFGIPNTVEDQIGRLDVVTHRYNEEKYLQGVEKVELNISSEQLLDPTFSIDKFKQQLSPESLENFNKDGLLLHSNQIKTSNGGLFIDKYSWNSLPIVAKEKGVYTGSARLIMSSEETPLPIFSSKEIQIDEKYCLQCSVEISQLAKARECHPLTLFGLLRVARIYSKEMNILDWVATIDKKVFNLLNKRIGFDIKQIGPEVDYLGSISVPSYINIENSIKNIEKSNPTTARFLNGEKNVPGFEWYQGV